MKNKFTRLTLLTAAVLFLIQNISLGQVAVAPPLGATASFAVFTASGPLNNDGASVITGDAGTFVGPLTGLATGTGSPGLVIGTLHVIDGVSTTAFADVATAYGFLAAESATDVIGIELGGQTLLAGVHSTGGAATLTGTLTLNGNDDPNSIFVIKIDGALSAAAYSNVVLTNMANVCNVYWQINGVVDLATYAALQGTVIAAGPINLEEYSTVSGRILATLGAINLHNTRVTLPNCNCSVTAPTVGAITNPSCEVATGSVVLNGLPATGTWTINPGAIAGTGTSTTLSGLASGTHNYTVTDAEGCISVASGDVVINPALVGTPIVGAITQPLTCLETGSVVLSGLPATGNWTINPGAITGTGTTTTITGLAAGTYNFTVTDDASPSGCISEESADVVIIPLVAAPTVTLTQPTTCATPTGTITVTAPTGTGMTYSIDGSIYTNTTGIFAGLVPGTYPVTARNADLCVSPETSVTIISSAAPAKPTVGAITQPICAVPTGSVVLSGLPAGDWTINPGAITGTGTTTTISILAAGTYNFTVTNICGTSAPSDDVVITPYTPPTAYSAPTVGTITQPTCLVPTGSVVLNGLPDGVTWYIHTSDNPLAIVSTGTGTSTTLYGLAAGTYNYTVTSQEVCWNYSAPSGDVVIIAIVATPTVTVTQPTTCTTPTGTITATGGGLTGDCYKYSIDGVTYTSNGTFTAVPPGTYTVTAINSDGCISSGTSVTINGLPSFAAPTVGTITQPTCLVPTGSVVLNGLPATGTWFINPGGIEGTGTTATISGLAAGIYHHFTVTSADVCWNYSAPSADIVITAIVATPTVTVTQPTTYVTPTGTITVTAPTGTGMTYSIDGSDYTNTNGIFAGQIPGTYPVTARNADLCLSSVTSVTINPAPSTVASATAQPTCVVATGTITVTAPTGTGMTYSINGVDYLDNNGIFTGLAPDTYTVTSKNSAGNISFGTSVTINAIPSTLAAPTVTLTQPTICVLPTGTITVTAPTGTGMTYSINGVDYLNNNGIFTGVGPGTYPVTAKNADGCITSVTSVTINAMPSTVATATAQPTSTLATGTITVTSPAPGGGRTYSINGVDYLDNNGIFTGVAPGTYSVTSSLDGCISSAASVTINPQPALPTAPIVTLIQPTTGGQPTGTITVTPIPGYCMTYSIVGSDGVIHTNTTGIFTGLLPGTYTVTSKDWGGSISPATTVTINDILTAIEKIGADSDFDVYPVPNGGKFTILINTLTEKNFDILISNAQGSKIYEEKNIRVNGKLEHTIDITQAPKGMYYIMLRSGNDQITRKIIKSE